MPSASLASTLAVSPTLPMLAYSLMCFPSRVTSSLFFSCCRSSLCRSSSCCFSRYAFRVSASGFRISSPAMPSMTAMSPSISGPTWIPIRAGIFMVLARIAVWELALPSSVTNPSSLDLFICTVSLGARSLAARITGSSPGSFPSRRPWRMPTTRSAMSFTSAERACMYSSSILANIREKLSPVAATAYSALIFWDLMMFFTESLKSSSSSIMACTSKMAALTSPTSFSAFSYSAWSCSMAVSLAFS